MIISIRKMKQYGIVALLSLALMQPVYAAGSSGIIKILTNICTITNKILADLNNLPAYIQSITLMSMSMIDTQDNSASPSIPVDGSLFSLWNTLQKSNSAAQLTLTTTATQLYLGTTSPPTASPFSANDVSYATLLGQPTVASTTPLATSQLNYLNNIAGTSLILQPPDPTWANRGQHQQDYYHLYYSFIAMQSYNDYIFNQFYQRKQKQGAYPAAVLSHQKGDPASIESILKDTIDQATNANWYVTVGSESLGLVLRQILMFNSQTYVLLAQLLETQQQLLTAQAMANSLAIQTAIAGPGRLLYTQAKGIGK